MDTSNRQETTLTISELNVPIEDQHTRQIRRKQLAVNIILASIFLERIAYYTLAANIALNLETVENLHWSRSHGLVVSFIFSGVSYISSIIFAVLSDWKLGRFSTILVGYVLYLSGYVFAIVEVNNNSDNLSCSNNTNNGLMDECDASLIIPMITIIGCGAGAVQSCTAVFASDQNQDSMLNSRLFDKYVVAVNVGAIFAMCATPFAWNQSFLYRILFIIAGSTLLCSAICFSIGWPFYTRIPPYDSAIVNCFPVYKNAFDSWREYNRNIRNNNYNSIENEEILEINERVTTFLDYARIINYGKFNDRIVNDIKSLRKALIVFSLLIPYWLVYHQINSTFRVQGQFDTTANISPTDKYNFTFLSVTDAVTIVIGVLLLNMFVYKCFDARNRTSSVVNKFIIGMCFACITMLIAGTVQKDPSIQCLNGNSNRSNNNNSSSIFVFIYQNISMGISEIFAMMASFEFAYFAAPRAAKTLFMSIRFCSVGIASFLNALYFNLFEHISSKINKNTNSCPYDYLYFYILAVIQSMFIIIFIICQKKFRIIKLDSQTMESSRNIRLSLNSQTN